MKITPKELAQMTLRLLIYTLKYVAVSTAIFYVISAITTNNAYIFLTIAQSQTEILKATLSIGMITLITWAISVLSDPTLRKK
jgi:hypothetical protein